MIAAPDRFEHELGTLITAAWAAECAETIAGELSPARPVRPVVATTITHPTVFTSLERAA